MNNGGHQESGLTKSVWSDADFEEMGWHDATIHGLSAQVTEGASRLLLDLDYIVRWVQPVPPAVHFSFWVAPATLVFRDVWDLEGDLDFTGSPLALEVADIHRRTVDGRQRYGPLWHIDGHAFGLRFHASGYRQYIRQAPILQSGQVLPRAERGDCSFAELGFS
jgi:hypothetical protein